MTEADIFTKAIPGGLTGIIIALLYILFWVIKRDNMTVAGLAETFRQFLVLFSAHDTLSRTVAERMAVMCELIKEYKAEVERLHKKEPAP